MTSRDNTTCKHWWRVMAVHAPALMELSMDQQKLVELPIKTWQATWQSLVVIECKFTPGLFTHDTRPVQFTLIADDFAVKWVNQSDFDHPLHSPETKHTMTCDMDGKQCAGMHLDWNCDTCEVVCLMDVHPRCTQRIGSDQTKRTF